MEPPRPLLLAIGFIPTSFLAADFFRMIGVEHDHTTVHLNGCGARQPDRTMASKVYINAGAFPSNLYGADVASFPLSRLPATLAVNTPDTSAPPLMAWQCTFSR